MTTELLSALTMFVAAVSGDGHHYIVVGHDMGGQASRAHDLQFVGSDFSRKSYEAVTDAPAAGGKLFAAGLVSRPASIEDINVRRSDARVTAPGLRPIALHDALQGNPARQCFRGFLAREKRGARAHMVDWNGGGAAIRTIGEVHIAPDFDIQRRGAADILNGYFEGEFRAILGSLQFCQSRLGNQHPRPHFGGSKQLGLFQAAFSGGGGGLRLLNGGRSSVGRPGGVAQGPVEEPQASAGREERCDRNPEHPEGITRHLLLGGEILLSVVILFLGFLGMGYCFERGIAPSAARDQARRDGGWWLLRSLAQELLWFFLALGSLGVAGNIVIYYWLSQIW